MKYFIGVDGGGTKTDFALFDEDKNILKSITSVGCNHENLTGSYDEAAGIIEAGIKSLVAGSSARLEKASILMGLAGLDTPEQHDKLSLALSKKGITKKRIYNDGYLPIKAGSPDGTGIGLNLGTGTCCNSADSRGTLLQLGGLGEFSGDKGNARWIAEKTFAAVYQNICFTSRPTYMTTLFCDRAGIYPSQDEITALTLKINDDREPFDRILTDVMFEAAKIGDREALRINSEMSDFAAEIIAAHVARQSFTCAKIPVILSGAMNLKTDNELFLKETKRKAAKLCARTLEFIKLSKKPVEGCVNWLLQKD